MPQQSEPAIFASHFVRDDARRAKHGIARALKDARSAIPLTGGDGGWIVNALTKPAVAIHMLKPEGRGRVVNDEATLEDHQCNDAVFLHLMAKGQVVHQTKQFSNKQMPKPDQQQQQSLRATYRVQDCCRCARLLAELLRCIFRTPNQATCIWAAQLLFYCVANIHPRNAQHGKLGRTSRAIPAEVALVSPTSSIYISK